MLFKPLLSVTDDFVGDDDSDGVVTVGITTLSITTLNITTVSTS